MSEIKSVRIRKLVKGSNTGNLDLKVTITSGSASNTQRFVKATIPTTNQTYWPEIQFSGQRYDSKTNDEILNEYISSNSAREISRLGLPQNRTLYRILQDPWSDKPPFLRNFGEDPYYLNNGATIKIDWKRLMVASYSFSPFYVYGDGTQSNPTQIVIVSDVTLDGKQPENLELDYPTEFRLFYDINSFSLTSSIADATFEATKRGFSNSFKNRNYFLEVNAGVSFDSFFQQYLEQPGDDFYFPPVGPSQIAEYVSGFEFSDVNLKEINTPNNIFKEVTIIPRRVKADGVGDVIEERRAWTFNSNFKPDFVYNLNSGVGTSSNSRYRFNYDIKDETIVSKTIDTWVKELTLVYPSAKNYSLKLSEPSHVKPIDNLIADYSPINGWGLEGDKNIFPKGTEFKFQIGGSNSNIIVPLGGTGVTGSSQSSVIASTASQVEKLKMQTQFPDNWIVRSDERAATFSLWIGDIESDIPPEGFIYSDEVEDMSLLSPEYIEGAFEGESEESEFIFEDESDYQIELDLALLDSLKTPENPPSENSSESESESSIPNGSGNGDILGNDSWTTKEKAGKYADKMVPPGFNGVPVYTQCREPWGTKQYGPCSGKSTVCSSGCGPTSVTMVVNYWAKKGYCKGTNPKAMADLFNKNGGRICGSGTALAPVVKAIEREFDIVMKSATEDVMMKYLRKAYPAVVSGAKHTHLNILGVKKTTTTAGHFVCLTGIDDKNRIRQNDPGYNQSRATAAQPGVGPGTHFEAGKKISQCFNPFRQCFVFYPKKLGPPV